MFQGEEDDELEGWVMLLYILLTAAACYACYIMGRDIGVEASWDTIAHIVNEISNTGVKLNIRSMDDIARELYENGIDRTDESIKNYIIKTSVSEVANEEHHDKGSI